ncbi:MAG: ZIP family metal transporter, partial [Coriobacteriales bacterium]|nr:ZIP family metal transporter [Coriobacteriales bacterium]
MESLGFIAGGLGFIFLMTTLGSACVLFFRRAMPEVMHTIFLGFAAGVMVAASVWSLLIPAVEAAEETGGVAWVPAAGGLVLGAAFLFALDHLIPHLHAANNELEGPRVSFKRSTLLVSAVTLHNIPEGMAVGLSLALALQNGNDPTLFAAATALALG